MTQRGAGDKVGGNGARYWTDRFSGRVSIRTVGDMSFGDAYNRWLYRAMHAGMRLALRKAAVSLRGKALCDVGAGLGAWIGFWRSLGVAEVVGIDIAPGSIDVLRRAHPDQTFVLGDIADEAIMDEKVLKGRTFDVLAMVNVTFHLTSEAEFSRGIQNAAKLLAPGGWMILSDGMGNRDWHAASYERHWPYSRYADELMSLGISPVVVQPLCFTLGGKIDPEGLFQRLLGRIHSLGVAVMQKSGRRGALGQANSAVGAALYGLDRLLLNFVARGPGLHVLIARKSST